MLLHENGGLVAGGASHISSSSFRCEVCGRGFSRQEHVRRHMMLHTGERPFKCKDCPMTFYREDSLKEQ